MAIKLQIGDAFRREEIDSMETLARIRDIARSQGFRVSPKHQDISCIPGAEACTLHLMLLLDINGDLVWADGADPEVERILHVSDLLAPDKPQGHPAAPILAEIADVAARNPRPWEEFQKRVGNKWKNGISLDGIVCIASNRPNEVRRKPRTVTRVLNGETWELPAPETCGT